MERSTTPAMLYSALAGMAVALWPSVGVAQDTVKIGVILPYSGQFADLAAHLITNTYINGNVVRLDGAIRFDPK